MPESRHIEYRIVREGLWCLVVVMMLWVMSLAASVAAMPFSQLVSFGDSLSDTGNIFEVSSNPLTSFLIQIFFPGLETPFPPPPYFNGRFTNGPVWLEHAASDLGLGSQDPSEVGGFNYAVGGATTFDDGNIIINLILHDDVEDQVNAYLSAHTPTGNELFIVEGGGNDLISGGITDVTFSTGKLESFITALYRDGGRNFLVPNLPPLGQIPSKVGGPNEDGLDLLSLMFNQDLSAKLDHLEQTMAGIQIFRVDFYSRFLDVLADPGMFGFTNTTDPAFDEASGTVVPNPEQYLFWDNIHPTAEAHRLLGDLAVTAISPFMLVPDFDGDGDVDGDDFLIWQNGFLVSAGAALLDGDADGDGDVDGDDFLIWQRNFPYPTVIASVPEPSSLVLLAMGGLMMLRRRKT